MLFRRPGFTETATIQGLPGNSGSGPRIDRRRVALATLLGLGVVGAITYPLAIAARPAGAAHLEALPPFRIDQWKWRNEEHWAVDQSVRDIAEMLLFSAGEKPSRTTISTQPDPSSPHTYAIRISGPGFKTPLEQHLKLRRHLWDPEDFQDLAQALIGRLPKATDPAGPSQTEGILHLLLTPAPSEIEKAQALASRQLSQHPRWAQAQEDAAGVLAVLGLFDQSSVFQDDRALLCRLTSHLALARALRAGATRPGPSGELASLALEILLGNNLGAAQELEAGDPGGPSQLPAPWKNVLYMLATTDWRPVANPQDASDAEALASFKGRWLALGSSRAAAWIRQDPRKARTHQGYIHRCILSGSHSVELGHAVIDGLVEGELEDLQSVWGQKHPGQALTESGWCPALNAVPERAFDEAEQELTIIGHGLWGQYFQNLLLDDMMHTLSFYEHTYGEKRAADTFWAGIRKRFGQLDLFPFLQNHFAGDRPALLDEAIAQSIQFARIHPERISDSNLVCLTRNTAHGLSPAALPRYQDWLAAPEPFGTLYNLISRTYEMKEAPHGDTESWRRLLEKAPYSHWVVNNYLYSFKKGTLKPEDVEFAYTHLKAFATEGYRGYLIATYPECAPEALRLRREAGEENPAKLCSLGYILAYNHREEEAAEAFSQFYRRCGDRVLVSNNTDWLVTYLWKKGRKAEAEGIARDAGEVYSASGLQTLAHLRELQGRPREAEAILKDSARRYGNDEKELLAGLLFRWKDRDPAFRAQWDALLPALFPEGLRAFDAAAAPMPPLRGVLTRGESPNLKKAGILPQAILVALDGYRVENQRQYLAIRSFSLEDSMTLVVFQQGTYQTLHTNMPGRRFGVDIVDYQARR